MPPETPELETSFEQILLMWQRANYRSRRYFLRKKVRPPLDFFLYKYKALNAETFDHISDYLLQSRLYLSSPEQVNDPFDTSGYVKPEGTTEEWRARFKALIANGEPSLNFKQRREQLEKFMAEPRTEWLKRIEQAHSKNTKEIGLCSFTSLPKSIVMWSHYAAQHSGICLQFEVAKDDTGTLIYPIPLLYVDEYPVLNWVRGDYDMKALLRHKHTGWAYEQERRIFMPEAAGNFMKFSPAALTGIILGVRTKKEDTKRIKEILIERSRIGLPSISLYKAILHRSQYKLNVFRLVE